VETIAEAVIPARTCVGMRSRARVLGSAPAKVNPRVTWDYINR